MVKTIAVLLDKYAWNAWLILVVLVKTLSRWCFTCTASELLHLVPLSPHFGKSVYVYPKWKHTVTFSVLNSRIVYFDVSTFRLISAQAPSNGIFSCKLTYLPVIFVFFGVPFLWKRFDRYRQTMFQAITRVSLKSRPVSVSSWLPCFDVRLLSGSRWWLLVIGFHVSSVESLSKVFFEQQIHLSVLLIYSHMLRLL